MWNSAILKNILLTGNAKQIQKTLVSQFHSITNTERNAWAQEISATLGELKMVARRQVAQKSALEQRITLIKNILQKVFPVTQDGNWRDAILENSVTIPVMQHQPINATLNPDHNASKPILPLRRLLPPAVSTIQECFRSRVAFFRGSTFATNRSELLAHREASRILDNTYGVYNHSPDGQVNGFTLALGDGCGGHYGDAGQDLCIARASWFAVKNAVRLFSSYADSATLLNAIETIVHSVANEINRKSFNEGTTLLCARAFLEGENLRVVGFNIGDSVLFAWNPVSQVAQNLASAHASEAGTAIVPSAYHAFEIHRIDAVVPNDTILFALSDGVVDVLPTVTTEFQYPNELSSREISLNTEVLGNILHGLTTTDAVANRILDFTFRKTDELRQQKLAQGEPFQVGDDVSIFGMQFQALQLKQHMEHSGSKCVIS